MKIDLEPLATAYSLALCARVIAGGTPSLPGTRVYFANIKDGDCVKSSVKLVFGLSGMGIAPAGVAVEGTAHHHLLIDRPVLADDDELMEGMRAGPTLLRFERGETETTLELEPGTHTLQLVLGDFAHVPLNPPVMSERITIHVS